MLKLNNKQVYNKINNLYEQAKQNKIPLDAALSRIVHILAGSNNDDAITYLTHWENFISIFPKAHYVKHYEKLLKTEQQDEYQFEIHELHIPKAEAEANAEKFLYRDVKELKHIKTLPNTLLQQDSKNSAHVIVANASGLKLLLHDLKLDAEKDNK